MKKTLNSGKIWTVLSAILFFMTCGVFVAYATTSGGGGTFSKWKTASGGGELANDILTASGWNDLMDALDQNAIIPDGAVMAFASGSCPDGWIPYDEANGRFIVGIGSATMSDSTTHTYTNSFGVKGGDYRTTLEVKNLPPHNHFIALGRRGSDDANDNDNANSIGNSKPGNKNVNTYSTGYTEDRGRDTNGQLQGTPFEANIPYIGLKYCIKSSNHVTRYKITLKTNDSVLGAMNRSEVYGDSGTNISLNGGGIYFGGSQVAHSVERSVGEFSEFINNNCGNILTKDCEITAKFVPKNPYNIEYNVGSEGTCNGYTNDNVLEDCVRGDCRTILTRETTYHSQYTLTDLVKLNDTPRVYRCVFTY